MATPEQLASWMTKIQEDHSTKILNGQVALLEVSPAEKIRYEENARFGEAISYVFRQLAKQDRNLIRTRIEYLSDQAVKNLSVSQQHVADDVRKRVLHLYDTAPTKEEVLKNLPLAYPYLFQHPDKIATFFVPERDIEVTALGAIVITIREEGVWNDEIIRNGRAIGQRCIELKGKNLPPMLERILLVQDDIKNVGQRENTRDHEVFHDLYGNVFEEMPNNVRYSDRGRTEVGSRIKDEIIAYLLNQIWQWRASALTGYSYLGQSADIGVAVSRAKKGICERYGFTNEQDAAPILNQFRGEIEGVCDELLRLQWSKSTRFDEVLPRILTAQTLKEIAFQLHQVETPPLRAADLITRVDGKIVDSLVLAGLDYARKYKVVLPDLQELKHLLEEEKFSEDAKGDEKNMWYSVALANVITQCSQV